MKIQTFLNGKGIIHGRMQKRIKCDRNGILKIGTTEIDVVSGGDSVLPLLFNGATGTFPASFTDEYGVEYDLGKVEVRCGRIEPPDLVAVEFMELRCRIDVLETENKRLSEKVEELDHIFDTNSLNFLIGGETK
jgi:hypothetical protein